jgi:hypothetical protein
MIGDDQDGRAPIRGLEHQMISLLLDSAALGRTSSAADKSQVLETGASLKGYTGVKPNSTVSAHMDPKNGGRSGGCGIGGADPYE